MTGGHERALVKLEKIRFIVDQEKFGHRGILSGCA